MKCPKCDSEDWKLASMVFKEGLGTIDSSTKGFAVGTGGISVGSAKTEGWSQTHISRMASPPAPPDVGNLDKAALVVVALIVVLICAALDFGKWTSITIGCIAGLFAFLSVGNAFLGPEKQAAYQEKCRRWEEQKMCMRCGDIFES